jgi:hypothetical protein
MPDPHLAPPGAGLPPVELFVARALFAVTRWTGNRQKFSAHFDRERQQIRTLVGACDAERGSQRVLIRRIPGLEDSSRNWSVWMTLDHLRIVHESIARVIISLTAGTIPPGAASTTAVKPSPAAGPAALAEFEASCDALAAVVAASPDLNTRVRYAHPWFGPLTAAGWHALSATHLQIHRTQLERIFKTLKPAC